MSEKEEDGLFDDIPMNEEDEDIVVNNVESENAGGADNVTQQDPLAGMGDPLLDFPLLAAQGEGSAKERSLKEFLNSMDEYAPVIPDAVTDFYLAKAGFETSDRRIKRLLALATQKFVSDIASDAYQYSRIRSSSTVASSSNPQARAKALQAGAAAPSGGTSSHANAKLVLTMEDLGNALSEYGLNIKRPEFYR